MSYHHLNPAGPSRALILASLQNILCDTALFHGLRFCFPFFSRREKIEMRAGAWRD